MTHHDNTAPLGLNVPMVHDDHEEVIPGVFVSRKAIAAVTNGSRDGREESNERWARVRQRWQEMKDDIDVSRQIVRSLETTAAATLAQRAEKKATAANGAPCDKLIQFVDVTAKAPIDAASCVLDAQSTWPGCEVQPIDLTNALSAVAPLRENSVDQVTFLIQCVEPQQEDELPNRICFSVPSFVPGNDPTLHTYVRLDSLPKEVRSVVRSCLDLLAGRHWMSAVPARVTHDRDVGQVDVYAHLVDQVDALHASVAVLRTNV